MSLLWFRPTCPASCALPPHRAPPLLDTGPSGWLDPRHCKGKVKVRMAELGRPGPAPLGGAGRAPFPAQVHTQLVPLTACGRMEVKRMCGPWVRDRCAWSSSFCAWSSVEAPSAFPWWGERAAAPVPLAQSGCSHTRGRSPPSVTWQTLSFRVWPGSQLIVFPYRDALILFNGFLF